MRTIRPIRVAPSRRLQKHMWKDVIGRGQLLEIMEAWTQVEVWQTPDGADINGLDMEGLDGTPTSMLLIVRKPYMTKMPTMPGRIHLIHDMVVMIGQACFLRRGCTVRGE